MSITLLYSVLCLQALLYIEEYLVIMMCYLKGFFIL
jgi:hypothetical protein